MTALRVFVIAAALALAGGAKAQVVINESVAGVKLGAPSAAVSTALGQPSKTIEVGGPDSGLKRLIFETRKTSLTVREDKVVSILTHDPKQRTAEDLGVGTTEEQLLKILPKAQCAYRGQRSCELRDEAKKVRTLFYIHGKTVSAIQISELL